MLLQEQARQADTRTKATLTNLMSHDWGQIYLYIATRTYGAGVRTGYLPISLWLNQRLPAGGVESA